MGRVGFVVVMMAVALVVGIAFPQTQTPLGSGHPRNPWLVGVDGGGPRSDDYSRAFAGALSRRGL
jgi:hypothetical protein